MLQCFYWISAAINKIYIDKNTIRNCHFAYNMVDCCNNYKRFCTYMTISSYTVIDIGTMKWTDKMRLHPAMNHPN